MKKLIWKRLNKTKLMGRFLQTIPFLRAVILNGSLAFGKSKESSDIDLLIIAKSKRIFTVRFFVNFIGIVSGQKRSKDEKKSHAGKFCFNYFLTDNYLKIPTGRGEEMDKYCAENYSKSMLVWGDEKLFNKFFETNQELFDLYSCHSRPDRESGKLSYYFVDTCLHRTDRRKAEFNICEKILSGKFGDWLEQKFKQYQINKIESDPRTQKYPDLIIYNDHELRFHPPKNV